MEKTAAFVVALLWEVLTIMDAKSFQHVQCWSDGATNFKNSTVLGSTMFTMLQHFGLHSWTTNYGATSHFKAQIDSHFAVLGKARRDHCLALPLKTIEDITDCYSQYFARKKKVDPSIGNFVNIAFVPSDKTKLKINKFALSSVMGLVDSYCFSCRLNDLRRTCLTGKGVNSKVCTALSFKNMGLSGATTSLLVGHPHLEDVIHTVVPEDEIADAGGPDEDIKVDTKFHNGWRVSFARHEDLPDKSKRLGSALVRGQAALSHLPARAEPGRHKVYDATQQNLTARTKARAKAHATADTAFAKRARSGAE
jgi:hypothetical protein